MQFTKRMLLAAAVFCGAAAAQAAWWYSFPSGANEWFWDDYDCWTGDGGVHGKPTSDAHCSQFGTIVVTNDIGYTWGFYMKTTAAAGGLTLRIKDGGRVQFTNLCVGYAAQNQGCVLIDEAGSINDVGNFYVGYSGYGVVTNRGTLKVSEALHIGKSAGSHGELVIADGGSLAPVYYSKNLFVGDGGDGTLRVTNSTAAQWGLLGNVIVGRTGIGKIVIDDGSAFSGGNIDFGGKATDSPGGRGELVLRGGEYRNLLDNPGPTFLFRLGTCTNGAGAIDSTTYGAIRGWGTLTGADVSRRYDRGVKVLMGHGEIVGDGEGVERELLTHYTVYSVSNVCPTASETFGDGDTESGWRAVNKGMVVFGGAALGWDGEVFTENTGYAGCALPKDVNGLSPNLVNAVRVRGFGTQPGGSKYIGVAVLAADRTDAHTNALPVGCNVLSVHKIGFFTDRDLTASSPCASANVAIRYDQTKIRRCDSRLELWRYTVADGKWVRLSVIKPDERPADKVIAMADDERFSGNLDERFNLGTFAVVERLANLGTILTVH